MAIQKEADLIETIHRLIDNVAAVGNHLKAVGPCDLGNRLSSYAQGLKKAIDSLETIVKRKL